MSEGNGAFQPVGLKYLFQISKSRFCPSGRPSLSLNVRSTASGVRRYVFYDGLHSRQVYLTMGIWLPQP